MSAREALSRLKSAGWLKAPETHRILVALDGHHDRTRVVGGLVRDTLLARDTAGRDIDMATELRPEEIIARAKSSGIASYPTGIEHGTVTLRVGAVTAEVTTLREDIETDGRHAVVRFGTDWTRDAERRDFTLNALYVDMDGTLFDPLHGLDDCLSGRVRFIGGADSRIAEDRLRVYRFFRFSASHGGELFDPDGYAACVRAAGTLDALSAERVGMEMRRMLGLAAVATTLRAMREAGVIDDGICPAERLDELAVYERLAEPPTLAGRLALLVADKRGRELQRRWRLSNAETALAERIAAAADLLAHDRAGEAAYRYPDSIKEAVPVFGAMTSAGQDRAAQVRRHLARLRIPPFPLTGEDLIARGMAPGPELGRVLAQLERAWIDSGFALGRRELLERIGG